MMNNDMKTASMGFVRRLRASAKLVGLTAFVATFVDGAMYSAIVPVFPYSLVDRSGTPQRDGTNPGRIPPPYIPASSLGVIVQFWVSSMLVTFGILSAVGSPVGGWACTHSRSMRNPFLVVHALALIATVCMCLAKSVWILLLSRALQGLSSGTIYISSIGMIVESVDKGLRGAWIGLAMSGLSSSLVLSPFIAGALYEHGGYYAVFAAVCGVITLAIILRLLIAQPALEIAETDANKPGYANVPSGPLNAETTPEPEDPPNHETPLLHRSNSNVGWMTLQWHVVSLIFGSGRFRAALFGGFIHSAILAGFDGILPLMVKETFGWGSTLAGTIFLAIALPSLLSPLAGAASDRFGTKRTAGFGFSVTISGIIPMALVRNNSDFDKVLLCCLLVVTGTGLTFVLSPLAADVSDVADELYLQNPALFKHGAFPYTFSAFSTGLGLATALGPALSGLLFQETSWPVTMFVLAAHCALASCFILCARTD